MAEITEKEARVTLRLETIQKNKILSGMARQQRIDYQDFFTYVYNAILGEHFLIHFNKNFNPIPDYYVTNPPKKVCVLDYLNSDCLQHYLDCVEDVIYKVNNTGCSVLKALASIMPKAKILFRNLSLTSLVPSIEKDVKKYQRQLKKGMVKNANITKPLKTTQQKNSSLKTELEQQSFLEAYDMWKNSKEFQDSVFEEEGGYIYKNGRYVFSEQEDEKE